MTAPSIAVTGDIGALVARRCAGCFLVFVPIRASQTYHNAACYDRAYNAARPVVRRKQMALPGQSRVERAFAEWIESEDGRTTERVVVSRARGLLALGYRRWGIASIWESIRYDRAVALKGVDGWKLNNSFRAPMARRVMERYPDLRGFFETRIQRGVA